MDSSATDRIAVQAAELQRFAEGSLSVDGGFGWLDAEGRLDLSAPLHTWVSCRMTYVFALALLAGDQSAAAYVDHGVAAIAGLLRDPVNDGWYASVDPVSRRPLDDEKAAYPHCFVVLALSGAAIAGRPHAAALLDQALSVVLAHFWEEPAGRTREAFSRDWSVEEAYRGANSSMHMVEAFLAAGDATGDPAWADRALRICRHLIHDVARTNGWRLPEHFTADWRSLPDYNADRPDDPFRPYGSTIGHWLEWSRLLLHVEAAVSDPPEWLLVDAVALFDCAVAIGWAVDGADGFVYTIGWDDEPVVRTRMHWVVAEGLAAAAVLHRRTGEARFAEWHDRLWDYTERYLVDAVHGSWHPELDPANQPASSVWLGKPDVYHAYQAVLMPRLPVAASLAGALVQLRAAAG